MADYKPKQIKKAGEDLVRFGRRVINYQKDILEPDTLDSLHQATENLYQIHKTKPFNPEISLKAQNKLEPLLRKHGGKIYPQGWLAENVDMILVAAIVVLTIRTFFLQPFIIPTNSMYPSYNGMTFELYSEDDRSPAFPLNIVRRAFVGASHQSLVAPVSGEIHVPVFRQPNPDGRIEFRYVEGRKWFGILPAIFREYTLFVGGRPTSIQVPAEFNLDDVIRDAFFPENEDLTDTLRELNREGQFARSGNLLLAPTSKRARAGEPVLRFDRISGDALFVDRFSYHFIRPRVGDPFVFRTREIEGLRDSRGEIQDKYYIKRIAGGPGDELEIREPVLMRNGQPNTGSRAFERNAEQFPPFRGYRALGKLEPGETVLLGDGEYFALGDNSGNSLDSRSFGAVPRRSIVGRAILIYYPFSHRWGLAR